MSESPINLGAIEVLIRDARGHGKAVRFQDTDDRALHELKLREAVRVVQAEWLKDRDRIVIA